VIRRAILGTGLALGACRGTLPATEIIVTVDTPFGVPCAIDKLHIEAAVDDSTMMADAELGADALPGSITLVPHGNPRDVTVTVTGLRAGVPFATARGIASFEHETSLELRFVLDRSCIPGPCPAVGVGGYVGLPVPQPRPGCGEHGYSWKPALFVMRDACAMRDASMGSVIPDVDEKEEPSPLSPAMPFPFWFYGAPVPKIWAGANGYLGFGDTAPNAGRMSIGGPRPLGEVGGFPGKGVLAFWDELRTGPAGVCFTLSGQLPDRVLWITWKEGCFANPLDNTPCGPADRGSLTFGIALEETTNRVYVGYRTMTATGGNTDRAKGNTATIGVTDAVPRGCRTGCSADGVCPDGTPCGYTQFSSFTAQVPLPTLEFDPL
jgi:hypothetical protein